MKKLLRIAFICVVGTVSGQLADPDAPRGKVPKNVDMSVSRGNEAETAVAVSHTNPQQITTVSNLEVVSGTFHSWSADGGKTWQHDVIADGDALGVACCDAQLASDDFGNIFLTYLSSDITVKMGVSTAVSP